jgi:hypothetical protein
MHQRWFPAVFSLFWIALLPGSVEAITGSWTTSPAVGPNQIVYTLDLTCPNPGFVCDLIDGYSDQDTSAATGLGSVEVDDGLDQIQFLSDSTQDVGSGPQDGYTTLTGTDVAFANIPFAGVPEITNLLVFALTNPQIPASGLDLSTPGDTPFSQTINYSGSGLVTGDLEFILGPNIIVPPADILVSGTFRSLGDVGSNGTLDYEIRDMTATFALQNLTTIGGENVTVDVTANMTLNLAGEVGTPVNVPLMGPIPLALLAGMLLAAPRFVLRRH